MPRDEYDDDRDDDRPRRRRRDRDDDDRPPAKSNTGVILLVVGLVVGLPMVACAGVFVWGMFAFKKVADQVTTMMGGQMAATSFLDRLANGDTAGAYALTSADFKAAQTLDQFERLVKEHPTLTASNHHSQPGMPNPIGEPPNRTVTLTFVVSPGAASPDDDFDPDDPDAVPKPKAKPKTPPTAAAKGKAVTCTIRVAEQPDGQWKVDGFTIP